jgi:RNA polymerase sigma factor (sigma-70 family)
MMQATQIAQLSDQDLILSYLEGNEKAFEILLRRHKARIYTAIYLFCKDQQMAEDIFQEVFIKIVNTLRSGRYNHEGKFLQWALRIAHNLCVDYFRRDKRRPTVGENDDYDIFNFVGFSVESPEEDIMRSQVHNRIRNLVDALPPEQREVVVLRHYADMSFKEIASLTRVSINTALGRMRYALINMRRIVEEKQIVLQ